MKKDLKIYGGLYYRSFGEHPPVLELKLGEGLLQLAQKDGREAPLLIELQNCRKYFDDEYGLIIPKIEVSFNENLQVMEYAFALNAVELGRAQVNPDGLDGKSPEVFIKEHIQKLLRNNITRILNRSLVIENINRARDVNPDIVDELLFKHNFSVAKLKDLLNFLLEENVTLIDMSTILETINDYLQIFSDPRDLLEKVREKLSMEILSKCSDKSKVVHGIVLAEDVTELITNNIVCLSYGKPHIVLEPTERRKLMKKISEQAEAFMKKGFYPLVFVCTSPVRQALFSYLDRTFDDYFCISDMEILEAGKNYICEKEGEITFEER